MTNQEILTTMIKQRDELLAQYENYRSYNDELLPFMNTIIRLNQEIRTFQDYYGIPSTCKVQATLSNEG
jgi:hypothetical protein